jgi:hypothetical protein
MNSSLQTIFIVGFIFTLYIAGLLFFINRRRLKHVSSSIIFFESIQNLTIVNGVEAHEIMHNAYYEDITDYNVLVSKERKREEKKLRLLIQILKVDHSDMLLDIRNFKDIPKSDPLFYEYAILYSVYFLLEDYIDDFMNTYGYFKKTIDMRPEKRVMNKAMNEIIAYDYFIEFDLNLLDLFYEFYLIGEEIDNRLWQYRPKNKLHELIYVNALYHYSKSINNTNLINDLESEYLKFKEIRKQV